MEMCIVNKIKSDATESPPPFKLHFVLLYLKDL